jgi:predicted nucleic acid-binding protein
VKVVVDTNIVFSAILNTEGKIGELIMNSPDAFSFHTCDLLRLELANHRSKLLAISGMDETQLDESLHQITNCLSFTAESLIPFEIWKKAADLVGDVDMNDIAFVALSEFLEAKLWTGDKELIKGLAKKGYTNFLTTDEIYRLRSFL